MFLKLLKYGLLALFVILLFIFLIDLWVQTSTSEQIFTSVEEMPKNKVGLLLGTRKMLRSGYINLYYSHRIDAAEQLFKSGKIEFILISGDNSREEYDEPTDMKNDLVERGVPENKIYLDYAGFRTLDSVIRANAIFGQEKFTAISQPFHNERAIFISEKKGLKPIGFNAKDVSNRYGWKVQVREKLARVKMLLDIIIGKQPKFYGEKIEIT
ncbi:YdcF family protein [bacterium]|nr:YdcF family protein [Saprospiraceae bacterium]MDB4505578.1 YdcF family protein [Saprospiraceae bacterium]MDC3219674.1 YdcF family protein [Saprospiraceae bacterium]MDC3253448.1 YdcF family protein [bacterium]